REKASEAGRKGGQS
ncbi:KGG domain-containing protein, partial [Mesorhizobium sp.]